MNALTTLNQPPAALVDPAALLAKGIESGLSVEALGQLLAMRRELQAEAAAGAFAVALAAFQADLPPISKSQTAKIAGPRGTFSYRYADLGDIMRAIGPRLAACGLAVTFDTTERGEALDVVCRVHHVGGHSTAASFPVPIDRTTRLNGAQQMGSALSYGRRYALTAALGIVTADDDDDAQSIPAAPVPPPAPTGAPQPGRQTEAPISADQHRLLEARISQLGLERDRVKAWVARAWGVQHLTEIPATRLQSLLDRLDTWADQAYAQAAADSHATSQQNGAWLDDYTAATQGH